MSLYQCCCKRSCIIHRDEFDRENSSDLGPPWKEEVGEWSVHGHRLVEEGTPGARVICQERVPKGPDSETPGPWSHYMHVSIAVHDEQVGDSYSLLGQYKDHLNYIEGRYTRLAAGKARIELYSVTGGNSTLLDSNDEFYLSDPDRNPRWLSLCITEKSMIFDMDDTSMCFVVADTVIIPDGHLSGISHGNSHESAFDHWTLNKDWADDHKCSQCPDCRCSDVLLPRELQAVYRAEGDCGILDGITVPLKTALCGADQKGGPHYQWDGVVDSGCLALAEPRLSLVCPGSAADITEWKLIISESGKYPYDACISGTPAVAYARPESTCAPLNLVFDFHFGPNLTQICPDDCLPCGEAGPAEPPPEFFVDYRVIVTE